MAGVLMMTKLGYLLVCVLIAPPVWSQEFVSHFVLPYRLTGVSFADTANGWIVGDEGSAMTTDAGEHWGLGPRGRFESVSLVDRNKVWITWIDGVSHNRSYVGKSNTGGEFWDTLAQTFYGGISQFHYNRIRARDSLRAWFTIGASFLADYVDAWHTFDGGRTWTVGAPLHLHGSYTDISLGEDSAAAILFSRKSVLRTTDEGQTWHPDTCFGLCNAIALNGETRVWVVGDSGRVFHSPKLTVPLSSLPTGALVNLNAVCAIDSLTVWVVGDQGTVLKTSDGGETWKNVSAGTESNLYGVTFVDRDHGWIVGDGGVILKYQTGTLLNVQRDKDVKSTVVRFSVFPNPFNSIVTISLEVPNARNISIEAYDLLGRRIAIIAQETVRSGRATFRWSPVHCASGIYILRCTDGDRAVYDRVVYLR
jgi:photosystem II stability/assembly factor-like uncharacterized protein